MTTSSTIHEQKTLTNEQWSEIKKLATIGRIADQIADLLNDAPELNMDSVFDFLNGLTVRKMKQRGY